MAKIVGVATTWNEAKSIGHLVLGFRLAGCQDVIIVDNCSTDGTAEIAEQRGATVIEKPCTISEGLMTGWKHAVLAGADYVLQCDAGDSFDPLEGQSFVGLKADLVVGMRLIYVGRSWRRFASLMFSQACNRLTGFAVADWTSGFRLFSRDLLISLLGKDFRYRGHVWQAEVLLRALYSGAIVKEQPVSYIAGRSNMPLRDWLEALGFLVRLGCRS